MNRPARKDQEHNYVVFQSKYSVEECIKRIRAKSALERGLFSHTVTQPVVSQLDGNRIVLRRNVYSLVYHRNISEGTAFHGEISPTSEGTSIEGEFVTHNSKRLSNPRWDKTILRGLILCGMALPVFGIMLDVSFFFTRTNLIVLFGFYLFMGFAVLVTISSSRTWELERSETITILSKFLQETLGAS